MVRRDLIDSLIHGSIMTSADDRIYILIAADDLEIARRAGTYRAASLAVEGFIHASLRNQLRAWRINTIRPRANYG